MSQFEWLQAVPATDFPSAPFWHPVEARLYWGEAASGKLFRLDPATGEAETLLDDGHPLGAIVMQADGSLLLFRDNGCVLALRSGKPAGLVLAPVSDLRRTRFSCAAADAAGRVVCASLPSLHHPARLYLLDRGGRLSLLREIPGIPSGMAFADDGGALLLSNSYATCPATLKFAYDPGSDAPLADSPSVLYDCLRETPRPRGAPAGIAMAADGSILVARVGGGAILRHVPAGDRLATHAIQVRRPVGLCFGGGDLRDLYVTTAGAHRLVLDGAHSGEVAVIRGYQVPGAPLFVSRIGLSDDATFPPPAPPPPAPDGGEATPSPPSTPPPPPCSGDSQISSGASPEASE